jgi:coenzyme F420-reducing hydrogenase beta subunit
MKLEPREPIACYAARTTDETLLKVSSSGGLFTELARQVFEDGGLVVGAGWNRETMCAEHKCASNEDELAELRGSKYTESDLSKVYKPVKEALAAGRKVLFTGMPCQVAAMCKTSGSDENLILCGIMCHSMAESAVWKKYVSELERKSGSKVASIRFRDKRRGWCNSTFVVEFEDASKNIAENLYENAYAHAYFAGLATRKSCLDCQFRSGRCQADLIIGDFWGVEDHWPEMDDNKGISAVLLFTEKGRSLFDSLKVCKRQILYRQVVAKNPFLETSVKVDAKRRERFERVYRHADMESAVRYALEGPWTLRAIRFVYRLPLRVLRFAKHRLFK